MSLLYEELKYNVDKINSLYKNGVTFHKNKTWIAPLDGQIFIEGRTEVYHATDYRLNEPCNTEGRTNQSITYAPDILKYLRIIYGGGSFSQVQSAVTNVVKGNQYSLLINDNYGEIDFNGVALNCRAQDNVNTTITKIVSAPGSNFFNPGEVYRVSSQGQINASDIGDCDILITDYQKVATANPTDFRLIVYFHISAVYRQPSQSPAIPHYFKIKYSTDVLSIFNDDFAA